MAQQQRAEGPSRRQQLAGLAALAAALAARPAQAGLFDGGKAERERYEKETTDIISNVRSAATLERDAPGREETMAAVRKDINNWVARYRRNATFSGRPSYGNVYSAVNAMAGHLNSFGPTAPVPKKRLERMLKELDDAEKFLSRGR
ncbi:Photosystem II repair PSB27- chloroplastic [Chlorella sorokiniana]|uniref:Photosystem II repair PSB27-chloroplastic n=1 Tax=Chlorella sorokiniana TaxID=3076 RepID=A0A2P6TFK0_CHLSO|nr:Photosystem II repair PSB27- chloroplastic [Chlorella sorokiniana]|eukprot:PRW32896.1 Photosystem II repair PSB27- chloroplastic [Chlorella sorokiniana]